MRAKRTSFDDDMEAHQTAWRAIHCESQKHGEQNKRTRAWILPAGEWRQGLWTELRRGGRYPLDRYLKKAGVQKHAGVHNLKSSWVQCANLYFPFGRSKEGRALLASFLRAQVDASIAAVERVELEWAGKGRLSPKSLLGESGGVRGSGQTSPDVAFFVRTDCGGRGIVLTENKLTEHSFYRCSARRGRGSAERPPNPDRDRCLRPIEVVDAPEVQCHQRVWGRRYWEWLAPVVDREVLASMSACPAAFAGYQLLRQQALAEALAHSSTFDPVVSSVAFDARNETLKRSLNRTGLTDFTDWSHLFRGRAKFAAFTHQAWTSWVRANDAQQAWADWQAFVSARYGL